MFRDPDAAIGVLNTYVLYLAFPILIVVGMTDRAFELPAEAGFYLVVPSVAALLIAGLALARRLGLLGGHAGTIALTSLFANTAYIGLPLVEGLLGRRALGLGSLAVAMHVTTAMVLGPTLLLMWGAGDSHGALRTALVRTARIPLAWAPVVGLVLRLLPVEWLDPTMPLFAPIGQTASPVGLFLIGLFLHTHARDLPVDPWLIAPILSKMLVVPVLTFAVVSGIGLEGTGASVLLLLSVMPTAISGFSIARELDTATSEVTVSILATTALAPLAIALASTAL